MKYFGLQSCRTCSLECFVNDNYTAVIRYNLQITDKCTKHQILSSVDQNKNHSSLVRIELQEHKNIVYANFDQYTNFGKLSQTAHYGLDMCASFPPIKGYNCPKVWLNHTELAYIRSVHPAPNRLYYYQESTSGSFVCLENYNARNDSTSNSYQFNIVCIICVSFFTLGNMIVYS